MFTLATFALLLTLGFTRMEMNQKSENPRLSGESTQRTDSEILELKAIDVTNKTSEYRHLIWPDRIIPFKIIDDFAEKELHKIDEAIADLEGASCIKFKHQTNQTDYIAISRAPFRDTVVGRRGGVQYLHLSGDIFTRVEKGKGLVLHELLHALGFHHEHTRQDRDQFLEFKPENLHGDENPRKFRKSSFETFGLPYDYSSIMHFGPLDYGRDGLPVLEPKDKKAAVNMGQRKGLSELDKIKLQKLYDCEEKPSGIGVASVGGPNNGTNDAVKPFPPVVGTAFAAGLAYKARTPHPSILSLFPSPRPPKVETGFWNALRESFIKPRSLRDVVEGIFACCLMALSGILSVYFIVVVYRCVQARINR